MFQQVVNWRTLLALVAIAIVSGTILYSNYLTRKISADERQKVEQWAEAAQALANPDITETRLAGLIITQNTSVPIIETNENDSIINFINIDTVRALHGDYLQKRLAEFKKQHPPVEIVISSESGKVNYYYYGESNLQKEIRYFPLIQLFIVALFIIVTIVSITTRNKATQNQVWAGMAKETAHQLGTPLSSIEGWVEMLKENESNEKIVNEMEKDVNRLKLVSERFGKIGSVPQFEDHDVVSQIRSMVDYIKRRATDKVKFVVYAHEENEIHATISGPLFDWVIENLLKNALDAMEGKGTIKADISSHNEEILMDISDTGKGIAKKNWNRVFKPGFTTKKRGWGLGLSLSKRIIEQYHKGKLFVKHSEPGKGTTFRIVLRKKSV